ncbi:hypothetical protein [Hyphobacterium marinum]|uniref:Secreted protein n=1 Tax=Hyphobacterium marinum TaxID=3116574 RepID=A0ABU7LVR0_9PROT|nr:hypothetical protein [Hyphobacterium sp. Y6023]MEE2565653.1 hypothetical protein [Hyphobacterium sp. Y6023]
MKYALLAIALLAPACAVQADPSNARTRAANEGTVSGVNENGERIRCEYIRQTGTRFRTRVCRTEEEWSRIEENTRQVVDGAQDRATPDPFDPNTGQVAINPRDR